MALSDFQILQKLGDGSYSSVYKVKRLTDSLEYALKKVKISHLSDREKENALNEVRILASIKHKNVASYKQAFFDEPSSSLCIVMEYADNGDVFQKICTYQQSGNLFKEKIIWKIFIQTVRGLKALHDLKILHRDMKSANIFLYRDYTAKLGDLNVSKVAKKGLLYTQTGTPYYASPEVWKDQPYDCKSDIWSLGCVLYEMCALVPPFRADDMNGLFKRVLKGAYPQIPSNYSMDMRSIIKSLLQVNPAQRPNTEQILDMPVVLRRIKKYFKDETMNNSVMTTQATGDTESELLKTIKYSKNLFKLKLPQPTYDSIQFATMPSHQLTNKSVHSRNLAGNGAVSQTMTTEKTNTSLPKIGTTSRNHANLLSSVTHTTHSTKSQQPRPALVDNNINTSMVDDQNDDVSQQQQNYEQDFEYEEKPMQQPHYMQPTQQYAKAQAAAAKARSYSGRHINNKVVKVENEYSDTVVNTNTINTNRSKSTVSYTGEQDTQQPMKPHLNIKQHGVSAVDQIRGLSQSPSQQMLQLNSQQALDSSSQKQGKYTKATKQTANDNSQQQPQTMPIDEKAELDSQYEDDFEKEKPRHLAPNKTRIVNNRNSGLKSNAQESVNTSNQDIKGEKENNVLLYKKVKQQQVISRSPSNQSLEKPEQVNSLPRSLQPSSLNNNKIIKGQQAPTASVSVINVLSNKKSPNIDRIVNIYSINKVKKPKKFYVNSVVAPQLLHKDSSSVLSQASSGNLVNDDIRVKLRQLREGIGYYEQSKNTLSRDQHIDSSRNQGNHSVLLPELKGGSFSPGKYQSNVIGTKKQSLDRILRGVTESSSSINRIYKKVYGDSNVSRVIGDQQTRNMPLKVRPSINMYRNNNTSMNSDLDIQGKSVISNKL